ncbi:MAG: tetrathionate reductase family octaheme c-type cytochrome [Leptospiraceae bacterium]|nr:tetrathionate reductase family octaheme c-type cytochrome [Leptospiraceae bacterium]MCP5513322.1 tetrathionate reductase family octaheme c-type cytochrome [Leptospiraceae bacterium]
MHKLEKNWIIGAILMLSVFGFSLYLFFPGGVAKAKEISTYKKEYRVHFNHDMYFTNYKDGFKTPQEVTKACLECHPKSADNFMKTSHWTWTRSNNKISKKLADQEIGKKNLINNFCINITGNWPSCTKCHAGYGWSDSTFNFQNKENIDCLACHDWSGTYTKGASGIPDKSIDLLTVAKSVGYPKRDNCGMCHFSGGGGMAVKHGDLDDSLIYAPEEVDVHMGKHKLLCIDCHQTKDHLVPGTSFSVSVEEKTSVDCLNCHTEDVHTNERLNAHTKSVACQTCHIPRFAKRTPTKMTWDWSKAGDANRKEDPHEYLKIKGEFTYDMNVKPDYFWFNKTVDRYMLGDKIDNPDEYTPINLPRGNIQDKNAKIWPFKLHRATQPYDKKLKTFMPVVTAGEGGFWKEFNWLKAIQLGSELNKVDFSGDYGFAKSIMYWPLSHMVSPAKDSLGCNDCHGNSSRMNWKELGYEGDPASIGSRKIKAQE